jgi:hypothetical protein
MRRPCPTFVSIGGERFWVKVWLGRSKPVSGRGKPAGAGFQRIGTRPPGSGFGCRHGGCDSNRPGRVR